MNTMNQMSLLKRLTSWAVYLPSPKKAKENFPTILKKSAWIILGLSVNLEISVVLKVTLDS